MERKCRITLSALRKMLEAARAERLHECCGLLAGREGTITKIFIAGNALASATAYEISPRELFSLVKEIRAQDLDFIGIYHSHPNNENIPSATDIERAYYTEAVYFIISPKPDSPTPVRAFRISDGNVTELIIEEVS